MNNPARTRIQALASPDRQTPHTVAQAFLDSLRLHGAREAIQPLDEAGITYAQLAGRVHQALCAFDALGLGAGDRIGIYLPNGPEWAVLTLAAAFAGACVVPINTRYRTDELGYVLEGAGVKAVFTRTEFLSNPLLERLQALAGGSIGTGSAPVASLPMLQAIVMMDESDATGTVSFASAVRKGQTRALEHLATQRRGDEALWLFWTSGTTSKPKAALMPQSTIEIVWQWTTLVGYRAQDRVLTSRPLFYIAGHFWSMLGPLLHGACMVIGNRFTTQEMVALCRAQHVTILSGNPMMFKRLVQDPTFDASAFADVRLGYFSGSALPAEEMKKIRQAVGFESMIQTYGMTELGGFIMSTLPEDSMEAACASCGYAFADIELRLVSTDTGEDVAEGEVGLLLTRGEKLIGYANLAEEERHKFYDAEGWYRTGDLMRRLPDGRYQLVGRAKDLIKVSGENVTAAEIEDTLMQHPGVSLAAVIARADESRGEVPVAFVELRPGSDDTLAELPRWTRSHMAPFKVPAEFHPMEAADWPLTSTGKIAKHELPAMLAARG